MCAHSLNLGFIQFDWKSCENRSSLRDAEQPSHPGLHDVFLNISSYSARTRFEGCASKWPHNWEMFMLQGYVTSRSFSSNKSFLPGISPLCVMYLSHYMTALCNGPHHYLLSVTERLECGWAGTWGFADARKP